MESYRSRGWAAEQLSEVLEAKTTGDSRIIEMHKCIDRKVDNARHVYERLGASPEEQDELENLSDEISDYERQLFDAIADAMLGRELSEDILRMLTSHLSSSQRQYWISFLQQEEQNVFRERRG